MCHVATHSATKACSRCGNTKPMEDFRLSPGGRRLSPVCWVCRYAAATTARARLAAMPPGPFDTWRECDPAGPRLTHVCRKCGREKPLAEFRLHYARGTRHSPCRACSRAYKRRYNVANRDKIRAYARHYYMQEDPDRQRVRYARYRRQQREMIAVRARTNRLRVLGVLTLADHCEDCGGPAALIHHETYGDVCALVSLCHRCHMARHYRVWRKTGGGSVRYPQEYEEVEGGQEGVGQNCR
ncbi:MAG TPA: hypothetical protein VNE39_15620 [Planctomycetota bacterium]|nr:hypothetical protein [Planctomycetota bacterium]